MHSNLNTGESDYRKDARNYEKSSERNYYQASDNQPNQLYYDNN